MFDLTGMTALVTGASGGIGSAIAKVTDTAVEPPAGTLATVTGQLALPVSGSVQPSNADKSLTATLQSALALVDVRVLDHIIVGPGAACSMAEEGHL